MIHFRYFFATVLFLALTALSFSVVQAQSEALQSAVDDVSSSIGFLAETKNATGTLGDPEQQRRAKVKALRDVFHLTLVEVRELKQRLEGFKSELPSELVLMRDAYLTDLETFLNTIALFERPIDDDYPMDAIGEVATRFKDWRETPYDPTIQSLLNFLLVAQGEVTVHTSDLRFEKISADVKKLQTIYGQSAKRLSGYLTLASRSLQEARKLQEKARDTFLASLALREVNIPTSTSDFVVMFESASTTSSLVALATPLVNIVSSSSLIISTTSTVLAPASSSSLVLPDPKDIKLVEAPSVAALLKQSLEQIRRAYEYFLEMSRLARKLLADR